ncbi:MAG: 50S ribosomal protein L15 [Spirochaetales bacterium]|nr:50S ribosomal protein L15 [Spirochaetales bacterium]
MEKIVLRAPKGATKKKKIIGRGTGSGHGSTAGRGSKGQRSRAGGGVRPGFEGGQMPLFRRIARRGFSNDRFKKTYIVIKCGYLEVFDDGATVTTETLIQKNIISKKQMPVKLLAGGTLTKKLSVDLDKITKGAREQVVGAGGTIIEKKATPVKDPALKKHKKPKKKVEENGE